MTQPNFPPLPLPEVDATAVVDELTSQLQAQPWYERFSNTVTSAFGLIILGIWVAASSGAEIDPKITVPVYAAGGVLTLLGLLKTKNGITPRGIETVAQAAEEAARKTQ